MLVLRWHFSSLCCSRLLIKSEWHETVFLFLISSRWLARIWLWYSSPNSKYSYFTGYIKDTTLFHRILVCLVFCNSDFCLCFSTACMSCISCDVPRCREAKEKYWGNVQELEQHLYKLYLTDAFLLVAFIRVIDACHVTHWGEINVKIAVHTAVSSVCLFCFVFSFSLYIQNIHEKNSSHCLIAHDDMTQRLQTKAEILWTNKTHLIC